MAAPEGNKNAAKGKKWQKALEKALARIGDGDMEVGLSKVADKVVAAAADGDKDAWKDIADRLDGKPAQTTTLAGDPDNPLVIDKIERVIVNAQN
jgi:hypothetical protein